MTPLGPEPVSSPEEFAGISALPKRDLTTRDLGELLRRSGRADEGAFAELYDATSARAFGLALRVVRDPSQAEEVTQEAFLEIWRTASRFDPDRGSAVSWILTIVHRKAVDRVRSAEASSRRDTTYHTENSRWSTTRPPRPHRPRWRPDGSVRRWTHSPRSSAKPWSSRTSGVHPHGGGSMLDLPVGTAKTRIRDGLIRLQRHDGSGTVSLTVSSTRCPVPTPSMRSTTTSGPSSSGTCRRARTAAPRSPACARPRR